MKKEIRIPEELSEEEARRIAEPMRGYIIKTPKSGCLSIIIVVFILAAATVIV